MQTKKVGFRDLKYVFWGATLKLALLRSFCGGLVWGVLAAFIHPPDTQWYEPLLLMPLGVPLIYFLYLPMGLLFGALSQGGVPFIGLGVVPLILFVIVGDPILWCIGKSRPGLIPVSDFGPFNLAGVIFVVDEERVMRRS